MIQFTNDEIVKQPITEDLLTNATPAQLTLLLFNGCCDFIKKGEDALSKKDYEQTNNWVQKAQSIISEFRCTLDPRYEIAKQLNPLYKYSYTCLMEGNMNFVANLFCETVCHDAAYSKMFFLISRSIRQIFIIQRKPPIPVFVP